MTKVIMHGCNGKMGQTITAMCKDDPKLRSWQVLICMTESKMIIRYFRISPSAT